MKERFVVFDVETPNPKNDRMSAIGVTLIEDRKIVKTFDTLIDPETWFHRSNSRLTGIYASSVSSAPTFPKVWNKLKGVFSDNILVAHNAQFDLSVLSKCLKHYNIPWQDEVKYLCTCRLGRQCLPDLPNHRLNTISAYMNISLDHHKAGSDSEACARILIDYLEHGLQPEMHLITFNMKPKSQRRLLPDGV